MFRFNESSTFLFALSALLFCVVGCGESGSTEVSSATSNFAVADDDSDDSAGSSEDALSNLTSNLASSVPTPSAPPTGASPVKPPTQPPAEVQVDLNKIPDGTPEEIAAFIDNVFGQMRQAVPQNASQEQVKTLVTPYVQTLLQAADKILSQEASDEIRSAAVQTKMQMLNTQLQLGLVEDDTALRAFAVSLVNEKSPETATLGRLMVFRFTIVDTGSGKIEDPAVLLTALDEFLANEERSQTTFMMGQEAATALQGLDRSAEAGVAMRKVGEAFKDTEFADQAEQLVENARLVEVNFSGKINSVRNGDEGAVDELLATCQELLQEKQPGRVLAQTMTQVVQFLEQSGDVDGAKQLIDITTESIKDHPDAELVSFVEGALASARKRVNLIGQTLDIPGSIHGGGGEFDWASYRGKYVLVDIWASWCGPCKQEFPNVKAAYAKYREMGFEVVGVSIDQDLRALDSYLAAEPLPWPTVLCGDPTAEGYSNPVADQCGVEAIPFVMLLDPEGKVLTMNVRGPLLEAKLKEVLGIAEEPPAQPAAEAPEAEPEEKTSFVEPKDAVFVAAVDEKKKRTSSQRQISIR